MPLSKPIHDDTERKILDAAEKLISHYGYEKTTIDDIASEAGVARSTLYSRWQKKEDLMQALVWRTSRQYLDDWLSGVESNPQGGTFAEIFHEGYRALLVNPLMMTLFGKNQGFNFIGHIMDTMDIAALYQQRIRLTQDFLTRLQQARVIRADINPATAAYVTNCLQFGFLQMQNTIQADGQPALEHTISMIVSMLDSYLTPQQGGDSEAGKVVVREMAAQFYTLLEQAENLST